MSPKMLAMNPCGKLVCGDALDLPFADNSFDLVFCANLLHHLDEPRMAIREMTRVSRRWVALVEPNRDNPVLAVFLALVPRERRALQFSSAFMRNLLTEAGLVIEYQETYGFITTNRTPVALLPLLRLLGRKLRGNMFHTIIAVKNQKEG